MKHKIPGCPKEYLIQYLHLNTPIDAYKKCRSFSELSALLLEHIRTGGYKPTLTEYTDPVIKPQWSIVTWLMLEDAQFAYIRLVEESGRNDLPDVKDNLMGLLGSSKKATRIMGKKTELCEPIVQDEPKNNERKKRRARTTDTEKLAKIIDYLEDHRDAKSAEVSKAKDIDESTVRRLWKKPKILAQKRDIRPGTKFDGTIKTTDPSTVCKYLLCNRPLSGSFECIDCDGEIIFEECKECHYTNIHPEKAIP